MTETGLPLINLFTVQTGQIFRRKKTHYNLKERNTIHWSIKLLNYDEIYKEYLRL